MYGVINNRRRSFVDQKTIYKPNWRIKVRTKRNCYYKLDGCTRKARNRKHSIARLTVTIAKKYKVIYIRRSYFFFLIVLKTITHQRCHLLEIVSFGVTRSTKCLPFVPNARTVGRFVLFFQKYNDVDDITTPIASVCTPKRNFEKKTATESTVEYTSLEIFIVFVPLI